MNGEAAQFFRSWRVGKYIATLTVPKKPKRGQIAAAVIEWDPAIPNYLTDAELDQYRTGRNAAMAELCEFLGVRGAVVEV